MSAPASDSSEETPGFQVRGTRSSPKGRSLHATQAFASGSLIATFPSTTAVSASTASTSKLSAPPLTIPAAPSRVTTCNHCLTPSSSLEPPRASGNRCTACRSVAYCSRACQKANWNLVHSKECKALKRAAAGAPASSSSALPDGPPIPTACRAAVQVLLRPDLFGGVETELEGNVEAAEREDENGLADLELQARVVLGWVGLDGAGGEDARQRRRVVELLCKIQTNAFSRLEPDFDRDGIFIDTTLAMANHSCVPNALVVFEGRTAYLKALVDIEPGQEIEVSYIDCTQPLDQRQKDLRGYRFSCVCPRCRQDLDNYQAACLAPDSVRQLNNLSLAPGFDPEKFQDGPSAAIRASESVSAVDAIKAILPPSHDSRAVVPAQRRLQLLHAAASSPSIRSDRWATEPNSYFLSEVVTYYTTRDSFSALLYVACLAAVEGDPYKYPQSFHPLRLLGCWQVASVLSQTMNPDPSQFSRFAERVASACGKPKDAFAGVSKIDQIALCQAILHMLCVLAPLGHSENWEVYRLASARVAQLREQRLEMGLVRGKYEELDRLAKNKDVQGMVRAFRHIVHEPVRLLAELGKAVIEADFVLDKDVCAF